MTIDSGPHPPVPNGASDCNSPQSVIVAPMAGSISSASPVVAEPVGRRPLAGDAGSRTGVVGSR